MAGSGLCPAGCFAPTGASSGWTGACCGRAGLLLKADELRAKVAEDEDKEVEKKARAARRRTNIPRLVGTPSAGGFFVSGAQASTYRWPPPKPWWNSRAPSYPPNGCWFCAASCAAPPGEAVICALPGVWTTVSAAEAIGAAAIANAAAPAPSSVVMYRIFMSSPLSDQPHSGLHPAWPLLGALVIGAGTLSSFTASGKPPAVPTKCGGQVVTLSRPPRPGVRHRRTAAIATLMREAGWRTT